MSGTVDVFLEMLAVEQAASQHTLDAYRRDIARFGDVCASRDTRVETAGADALKAFVRAMEADGEARTTQNRRLSAVRRFLGFLYAEGLRPDDPGGEVSGPRTPRTLPKVLSPGEVDRLMATAEEAALSGVPGALRRSALIELLYGGGLRVTELVSLPEAAFAAGPSGEAITVSGRGGASGWCPSPVPRAPQLRAGATHAGRLQAASCFRPARARATSHVRRSRES